MRESEIVRQCLDYLKMKGIYCWRQNQAAVPLAGGGFRRFSGLRGVSDILGIHQGRFLAVEVKTPIGRVSDYQKRFLSEIQARGGIALIVRSVDELATALDIDHRATPVAVSSPDQEGSQSVCRPASQRLRRPVLG